MASSLALKRLVSSNILPRSLRSLARPAAATPSSRFFNTDAARDFDYEGYDRDLDVNRSSGRSASNRRDGYYTDPFFPFTTRSLSQALNLMDRMDESPFFGSVRRGWEVKETDDGLNVRVDMPGLGKEDVEVSVEQNTLVIKGEGGKEEDDEENLRRYINRIDLPEKVFKTDQIKAEMKNGVLKVVVPKLKEEGRNDVFHVKVE